MGQAALRTKLLRNSLLDARNEFRDIVNRIEGTKYVGWPSTSGLLTFPIFTASEVDDCIAPIDVRQAQVDSAKSRRSIGEGSDSVNSNSSDLSKAQEIQATLFPATPSKSSTIATSTSEISIEDLSAKELSASRSFESSRIFSPSEQNSSLSENSVISKLRVLSAERSDVEYVIPAEPAHQNISPAILLETVDPSECTRSAFRFASQPAPRKLNPSTPGNIIHQIVDSNHVVCPFPIEEMHRYGQNPETSKSPSGSKSVQCNISDSETPTRSPVGTYLPTSCAETLSHSSSEFAESAPTDRESTEVAKHPEQKQLHCVEGGEKISSDLLSRSMATVEATTVGTMAVEHVADAELPPDTKRELERRREAVEAELQWVRETLEQRKKLLRGTRRVAKSPPSPSAAGAGRPQIE